MEVVLDFNVTGIDDQKTSELSIYPIPADTEITVKSHEKIELVRLLNLAGQVIYEEEFSTKQTVINVSELIQGLYLIQIVQDGETITRNIVIQ